MEFYPWTDKLSVGIPGIDKQHKELVKMINQLHDAMLKGSTNQVLGKIIQGLVDYTKFHFGTEEKIFDRINYPFKATHKVEHDKFVKEVLDFQREFQSGGLTLSMKVMNFLKDWLNKHIMGTDKKYAPYFAKENVKV